MPELTRIHGYARLAAATVAFAQVLVLFPVSPEPAVDIKNLLLAGAAAVLGASYAVAAARGSVRAHRGVLVFWPFSAFALISVSASLLSAYPGNSLAESGRIVALFLLYWVASQAYSNLEQARPLIAAYCVAVFLASLYGMLQKAGVDPFPWDPAYLELDEYRNLPATFGNPNLAGHALLLANVLSIFLATQPGWRWTALLPPVYLLHLVLAQHRASLVSLAASGVVVAGALAASRVVKNPARGALAFCAGLGLAAAAFVAIGLGILASGGGGGAALDSSLLLRYNSIYSGSHMIVDAPLTGFGPGNYEIENPPYWTRHEQEHFARKRLYNRHTHCEPLQAGIDAGLPGALAYLALMLSGIFYGVYFMFTPEPGGRRQVGALLTAFFTAMLVDGVFGFNLRAPASATLFALIAGALDGAVSRGAVSSRGETIVPGMVQRGAVALAVLTMAAFTGTMGLRIFASQVRLQQGLGAVYWKDYEGAIRVLNAAHRWAPWNWLPPYHAGNLWAAQAQHENAIANYEYALTRHPNYIPAHIALAKEYFIAAAAKPGADSQEFLSRCRRHLDAAARLCPVLPDSEDVSGRIALAHATGALRDASQARDEKEAARAARSHFTAALAYGAENRSELYRLLAQTAMILDEANDVSDYFDLALQALPVDPLVLTEFYRWAAANRRLLPFQQSVERYADALAARQLPAPDDVTAVSRVWRRGESALPEAIHTLADAVRRSGAGAASQFAWAGLSLYAAADAFKVENPDDAQTLVDLAAILDYTGEYAAAEHSLLRAEAVLDADDRARCAVFRARIIAKLDRCDEASALMRPLALEKPADLDIRLAYAELLAFCGRRNEALFEFEMVTRDFQLDAATHERIRQSIQTLRQP
ncbi:MAG: hypothetical protein AMXMBFR4_00450 [Candidatus Hydrogenedentota bacterium]